MESSSQYPMAAACSIASCCCHPTNEWRKRLMVRRDNVDKIESVANEAGPGDTAHQWANNKPPSSTLCTRWLLSRSAFPCSTQPTPLAKSGPITTLCGLFFAAQRLVQGVGFTASERGRGHTGLVGPKLGQDLLPVAGPPGRHEKEGRTVGRHALGDVVDEAAVKTTLLECTGQPTNRGTGNGAADRAAQQPAC